MIELPTPRGLTVRVPESDEEDRSQKFAGSDPAAILSFYREQGYVILPGLMPVAKCDEIRRLWEKEIKPSRAFMYRQATAKAERHSLNEKGWVMNPILNLQSVDPLKFGEFRRFATEQILADAALADVFETILEDKPKVVQSMYFEGNSATWEHQDTYYLDSEKIGSMAGAWIALEDIDARAGRFFICPGSHLIELERQNYANNVADHHEDYISEIVSIIRERALGILAPNMSKGDVLFWNSRTIHGSLASQHPEHSRSSITLHAIPAGHRFLQLQNRIKNIRPKEFKGVLIHQPKDLSRPLARCVLRLESWFPTLFYATKGFAIKLSLGTRRLGSRPSASR